MKDQIDNLINLAKDYVQLGIEVKLEDTHNRLRSANKSETITGQKGRLVNVYFSNGGETWAVKFGNVEISGYRYEVLIPFDADADSLQKEYLLAKEFLENYLLKNKDVLSKHIIIAKQERIKTLEKELDSLKNEI